MLGTGKGSALEIFHFFLPSSGCSGYFLACLMHFFVWLNMTVSLFFAVKYSLGNYSIPHLKNTSIMVLV